VVLVNDLNEIWWVDNRHVRVTFESEPPLGLPMNVTESHRYIS